MKKFEGHRICSKAIGTFDEIVNRNELKEGGGKSLTLKKPTAK